MSGLFCGSLGEVQVGQLEPAICGGKRQPSPFGSQQRGLQLFVGLLESPLFTVEACDREQPEYQEVLALGRPQIG